MGLENGVAGFVNLAQSIRNRQVVKIGFGAKNF